VPPPPDIPISYLGGLAERIASHSALSFEEQTALVIDLKRGLQDPETGPDAQELCKRLKKRRDLFAAIDRELDQALADACTSKPAGQAAPRRDIGADSSLLTEIRDLLAVGAVRRESVSEGKGKAKGWAPPSPGPAGTTRVRTTGARVAGALLGGVVGTLIGLAATMTTSEEAMIVGAPVGTVIGAIAGALFLRTRTG
jgi:hypothetical protein